MTFRTDGDTDMVHSTDRSHIRRTFALYAVAALGSAALGALLSIIMLRATESQALANTTLGIAVALGNYPILSHRALTRGVQLTFWKYACAFVALAFAANFIVNWIR